MKQRNDSSFGPNVRCGNKPGSENTYTVWVHNNFPRIKEIIELIHFLLGRSLRQPEANSKGTKTTNLKLQKYVLLMTVFLFAFIEKYTYISVYYIPINGPLYSLHILII